MTPSELVVNCSILFGGLSWDQAFARVRAAGFSAVEFWWPFSEAVPDDSEIDVFLRTLERHQLDLVGINLFSGDMSVGDRGVLSWPGREEEFRASVGVARQLKEATGCSNFNALYGRRREGVTAAAGQQCAFANLAYASAQLSGGGRVVLEALSGFPDYPLKTAKDVADLIADAHEHVDDLGMQLDVYHHWANGDHVDQVIATYAPLIAHVQLADAPGRVAPGTGDLPLRDWLDQLESIGYGGRIALEFVGDEDDPLAAVRLGEWR